MTRLGVLGTAAAILSSVLAGPAMAQQVISDPGKCAAIYPNANCQNLGPGNPYTGNRHHRRVAYRNDAAYRDSNWNNGWHDSWNDNDRERRTDSGFWPADVAAGAVEAAVGTAGAAIGTAGAIASAPFREDSYAYYNGAGYDYGDRGWDNRSYAERNGFVCQPGTWFKGEDGRRHICQ